MTKKVLLIDDDLDIQEITQIVIRKIAGWTGISATTGIEGLQKAKTELPDAILLDISMPDMDGFQVFEQLQADPVTRSIPVILLTAKTSHSDRDRFAEMAIAGVISKPFDPVTLWQQVATFLGWPL
ncbi:MAG TPA: response regulator [Leptolyngbyaceae cyanobacterium M33_DOE_097]|uniref:Response regulator n=1 Tax=Oscillatoriales cyanobacterium SpSt-418 TaxID=2282169 RepID=A0A7C3PGL0_9CYAN|nr:response regulator [Leptolyngbyaceae cyanobacterium M33_DOE_097]